MQDRFPQPVTDGATRVQAVLWTLAAAWLALAQVIWAGYQFGVGNQSIQVPFLLRLHDPALYPADVMVNETIGWYPSRFFALLAPWLRWFDLATLYLTLHLVTAAGVLIAGAALCRAMFRDRWSGLVLVGFLLAGHHRALAEEALYSSGFTHTWAVFPLALAALALLYHGRTAPAFLLAGALFNFHALEAGHLGAALAVWAVTSPRAAGWRRRLTWFTLYALAASPTLLPLLFQQQAFDATWQQLMEVRSAHQSFPFSWWHAGQPDLARFAVSVALAGLAMSLLPPGRHRGITLRLAAGIALLFVAGVVFTEIWPQATVIRAQLLRSSRFALVLALAYIAAGCARAWALPFQHRRRWRDWLEFANATLVALCFIVPPWLVLLPAVLVITALVALLNRRLPWPAAALAGGAGLACLAAWRSIHFVLPGLSPEFSLGALIDWRGPGALGWALIATGAGLWWLAGVNLSRRARAGVCAVASLVLVGVAVHRGAAWLRPLPRTEDWVAAQEWVRQHTPADALVLTPIQPGGFRLHSRRSVVGEWRDGTQMFFSAGFAAPWWARMNALQPGMRLAPEGNRLLVQGRPLGRLGDDQLLAIARAYGATHIVLPSDPARPLVRVYHNETWSVYRPRLARVASASDDALARQEQFLAEVARPNIARYRQSDVRIQVLDPNGRPLYDVPYRVIQTGNAFGFGASLPPFSEPAERGHEPVPIVTERQLQRFAELFNFSVVTQSAWWSTLEPQPDQRHDEDLERYLAWCAARGVATEFSFLSGFPPGWLREKPAEDQRRRLLAHATDLVRRHGDRVKYWQVTDQGLFAGQTAELIGSLRATHPQVQLGISDAARFYSPLTGAARDADRLRGLELVRRLKQQGVRVDFVALHAHQPWGVWADARDIYAVLDAFAQEGVRVHLTEFGVPADGWIEGAVRSGRWDPALRAAYYRMFYTVAYSHPAVDVINHVALGARARGAGLGLLDEQDEPTPAYAVLHELITKEWRTDSSGALSIDGRLSFRGYHGDYELVISPPAGEPVRATFRVTVDQANDFRYQLDAAGGALGPVRTVP